MPSHISLRPGVWFCVVTLNQEGAIEEGVTCRPPGAQPAPLERFTDNNKSFSESFHLRWRGDAFHMLRKPRSSLYSNSIRRLLIWRPEHHLATTAQILSSSHARPGSPYVPPTWRMGSHRLAQLPRISWPVCCAPVCRPTRSTEWVRARGNSTRHPCRASRWR